MGEGRRKGEEGEGEEGEGEGGRGEEVRRGGRTNTVVHMRTSCRCISH